MIQIKPQALIPILIIPLLFLIACNTQSDDLSISETISIVPELGEYEFFIEGVVDDHPLHYKQINYDWYNNSNTYYKDFEQSWLQAYSDSLNYAGSWEIRIQNVDIESIDLPYTLSDAEANIYWFDSRVDTIIQQTDFCQGIDNGCTFFLNPERGDITITKIKDQIIEGHFNGRAILLRTGFAVGQDESLFYDIENGKFRIKYRVQ